MTVERVISIGFILFGAFFFVLSLTLESRPNVVINPGTWPAFLTAMIVILGAVLLIRTFKKPKETVSDDEQVVEELLEEEEIVYPRNFFYLIGLFVIYIALLNYLGFIITTVFILIGLTMLFGMQSWWHRIITSIVSTACFVFIFPILLQTPFPRGVGIFRTISLFFY